MRYLLPLLILTINICFSQQYEPIDQQVRDYPDFIDNLNDLSIRISNDFGTDEEKVRAIFVWITENIKYDMSDYKVIKVPRTITYWSDYELERTLRKLEQQKIDNVIQTKRGQCYGYSLLFAKLCQKLNIEAEVIKGYAKTDIRDIGRNRPYKNHAWNAVRINGDWKLIDTTWGAGYENITSKTFIKRFNDYYFFSNPEEFISHHFPESSEWQFLEKPLTKKQFFAEPIFYPTYFKLNMKLSSIHNGILTPSKKKMNIFFDELPNRHSLYYAFEFDNEIYKASVKKIKKGYMVTVRLRDANSSYLTLFGNLYAIINFKVDQK